jgi:signal transduction histidine kinase
MKIGVDSINSSLDPVNPQTKKIIRPMQMIEKNIRMASVSSKILQSLTEDILDFAKIEAGIFSLNQHPFVIQNLIDDITYIFEYQCKMKRIRFEFDCSEALATSSFNSDIDRIKQIMMNLISNAYKFTHQGGIDIHIT